jgi:hypothetical protein
MHNSCPSIKLSMGRTGGSFASLLLAGAASLALSGPAHATLDSSITSLPDAAAVEGAINSAIGAVEGAITSPNNITVSIDFQNMSSGLGESTTAVTEVTYYQYYNAFKTVATQTNQLAALASLGTEPTSNSSPNPVDGSAFVQVTSAQARNLGFSASPSGFDSTIGLNTSITYPPQPNNGSTYSPGRGESRDR